MAATCDHCGESFGNEGAAKSHQAHCDGGETANNRGDGGAAETTAPAPQPAADDTAAQVPAQQGSDPVEMGMQLGQSLAGLRADDPEQKAQAEGMAVKTVGAAIAQFGEQVAKEKISQVREAKSRSGDDLQVSEEYPTCAYCDRPIKQVPQEADSFDCPHCGTRLEWA